MRFDVNSYVKGTVSELIRLSVSLAKPVPDAFPGGFASV